MLSQTSISIISISDIRMKETIVALKKSFKLVKSSETILFTSQSVRLNKYEKKIINIIKIPEIKSIKDYSNFIIYELYKYIKTSHVLIVQWDGYIINKNKWDLNFFNYDYIGAPFIPRSLDEQYSRDQKGAFYVIGNGGFSLRSRRLLEAPSKFKLVDDPNFTNMHEDGFFCVYHRSFLESKGFIWAPFYIAKEFSIESPLCLNDLKELPFGFHGKKMIYIKKFIKPLILFFKILKLFSF